MRPLVIAHRGASHEAPENTVAAFRAAAAMGADGFETDVQLTKDGRMVIHHNYTIDANSNGSGNIIDMTEEELRRFDFGIHKGPEFAGEKMPTLAECLAETAPFKMVNIELKAPMDRTVPYVKPVAEAIRNAGLVDKIIISAFDHSLLKEMKEILPEIRVGALTLAPLRGNGQFELLKTVVPMDKPACDITREDLKLPPEGAIDMAALGVPGKTVEDVMMETAHSMSALFPGKSFNEIEQALMKQQDLDSYVGGLDFKLDYLHCEYNSLLQDPALVGKMHARGIGVNPWTPDDPEELKALIAMGPDGIITNRPDILMELLKED